MAQDESRIPVIIGAGEVNDRPETLDVAMDSVALMAEAARRADVDAGGGALAKADYMAIVPQISFRDLDERVLLPQALDLAGVRRPTITRCMKTPPARCGGRRWRRGRPRPG